MPKPETFKLTFTPERMAAIIQAGMQAEYGIIFEDKLTKCVNITCREPNTTNTTYLMEFTYANQIPEMDHSS